MILLATHLKWAWDYLLCQSFSQRDSDYASFLSEHVDDFNVACYKDIADDCRDSAECAVCLCKIDDDDEVRELRCDHFFHRVCLDRWLGYGHMTCPVCRNRLKLPPLAPEIHRELVVFDFYADGYGGRERWWLR
ncbi:probable E3 ubiquitin-protein ligase xerico [Phtheirospermum japonicum]|uniref:Probable E3 ubiquitin-protein ligase xerico n=1 Tax=Phtheirospermum japonicum TaxID=374723 RepID=A0A830CRX4_9LAMI|nr:probable E3 ubiquitin-protein ligase xerico [Phtheirospermum japonicum]